MISNLIIVTKISAFIGLILLIRSLILRYKLMKNLNNTENNEAICDSAKNLYFKYNKLDCVGTLLMVISIVIGELLKLF